MSIEIKGGSKRRRRGHRRPAFSGIVVGIIILLLLGVIGSMLFVWYSGQQNPVEPAPLPTAVKRTNPVAETPKAPPTGPVGVSSQVFTSPVAQGENASISIRTRPLAACSITVTYKDDQRSKDAGLVPKAADEFGTAQWTWTVETSRPVGKWPVEVTCGLGENSGYLKLDLEVTPAGA